MWCEQERAIPGSVDEDCGVSRRGLSLAVLMKIVV